METPSSVRRVTRSQASAASQKNMQEDALSRSRNGERSALLDITNDSPIVGVATGSLVEKTPSSSVVKNCVRAKRTPGSGEALLRSQVRTLLQKVEEEAELVNKFPSGHPAAFLLGLPNSPAQLLAPTPANTPHIPGMSGLEEGVLIDAKMPCVSEDNTNPQQAVAPLEQEKSHHSQECLINRALLFDDSPGKSEMSNASTISSSRTYQGSESSYIEKSSEDDDSSIWSLQVNASIQEDDDEDIVVDGVYYEEAEDDVDEEEDELLNDLCEGLRKISVQDKVRLPECTGKHTRFIYNSDDEIEGEEEVADEKAVSSSALLLRGLPAPEGKHLRFPEEDEV